MSQGSNHEVPGVATRYLNPPRQDREPALSLGTIDDRLTSFLGNEGNAGGGGASAHALLRQVVAAVLAPVLVSFLASSRSTQEAGHLRSGRVSRERARTKETIIKPLMLEVYNITYYSIALCN